MNEKLYRVDQFYTGDFAQILIGVYTEEFRHSCEHKDCEAHHEKKQPCIAIYLPQEPHEKKGSHEA